MSQIIGGHTFVPLERNIDDVKLNSITGGAVITSELISTQTLSTSAVTGDQFLLLKAGGTLARILYSDLAKSVVAASISTDAGNQAKLGSDSLLYVPASSVSLNTVGNSSFECDQRNVGTLVANPANGAFVLDRWIYNKTGTMVVSAGQQAAALPDVCIPATSFRITSSFLRLTVTTPQVSLGVSDTLYLSQMVEGPLWRELSNDVHSVSLLVRSSVPSLSFGLALKDSPGTKTLTKLCTLGATPNTWTLLTLPNLPVWPAGNFVATPGAIGYQLLICLAAGTSVMSSANNTWQTANVNGAIGQSNFAASAGGSTFDIAFCQHQPGSQSTTLIDKPWSQNYDEVQRFYQKSYDYATAVGTNTSGGAVSFFAWTASTSPWNGFVPYKKKLAKWVTPTLYSTTGAAGAIRDTTAGVDRAVSAVYGVGESAFLSFLLATAPAASANCQFHYVADTGW